MSTTYSLATLHRAFRALPKVALVELRDAATRISSDVAGQAQGSAAGAGRGWRYLGGTIKASRDRYPVIKAGGTKRLTGRSGSRQTVGDLLFGTEFGGRGRPETMQFLQHLGTTGYVIWPTIRELQPDIGERYSKALDVALIHSDMAADRELKLNLIADVGKATASVQKLDRTFTSFGGRVKSIGADIGARFNAFAIGLGTQALSAGIDWLQQGVQDAVALQSATDQLALAMRRAGSAMPVAQASEWIQKMELATNVSDVDLTKSLQGLTEQLGSVRNSQRILALATEVSAAKGIDLGAAIKLVTGAYYGSARAARALGTEGKKGWKAITEAEERFEGSNKKRMQSIEGRWATINTRIGELGQAFGTLLLPFIEDAARVLTEELVPALDDMAAFVEKIDLSGFTAQLQPLLDGLRTLGDLAGKAGVLAAAFDLAFAPILGAFTALGDAVEGLGQTFDQVMAGDIPAAIETALGVIRDLMVGGLQIVLAPLIMVAKLISAVFAAMGIDIGQVVDDVLAELRSWVGKAAKLAGDVGKAIYDGIVGWIGDIADTVATMVDDVLAELARLLAGGEGNVAALRDKWLPDVGPQSAPQMAPMLAGGGASTAITINVDGAFGTEQAVMRALRSAGRLNGSVRLSRVRPVRFR